MSSQREQAAQNTDVEIWRGKSRAEFGDDDRFYADSLFIPQTDIEALGINCGGTVIVKPIREWHKLGLILGHDAIAEWDKAAYQRGFDEAKERLKECQAEFSILSRAVGNWREFGDASTEDWTHPDWLVASKAILERNELRKLYEALTKAAANCNEEMEGRCDCSLHKVYDESIRALEPKP